MYTFALLNITFVSTSENTVIFPVTSTSELSENESEESDRELSGYSCCHCYTTSKYINVCVLLIFQDLVPFDPSVPV